jgi:hypothetical protein
VTLIHHYREATMNEASTKTRHARAGRPAAGALALLLGLACGQGAPGSEEVDAARSTTTADPAAAPATAGEVDPCELVTTAEWIEATGYDDVQADRSARDTCDILSDALVGVVGSVTLAEPAMLDFMRGRSGDASPVTDLGDEAIRTNRGTLVRVGDDVVWVMVNPSVEDHASISESLARLAVARL